LLLLFVCVAGLAEFVTLLQKAKAASPRDVPVFVTLNGDFLWRSELDRQDKGCVPAIL
jgi:hypothetical protein